MPGNRGSEMWRELSRVVRYALASNPRTARLAILIVVATAAWQIVLFR